MKLFQPKPSKQQQMLKEAKQYLGTGDPEAKMFAWYDEMLTYAELQKRIAKNYSQ